MAAEARPKLLAVAGLQCLELGGNRGLGDAGVEAMAEALAAGRLRALKNLELDVTGMGDAGAAVLAKALGGAPALEMLAVGGERRTADLGHAERR